MLIEQRMNWLNIGNVSKKIDILSIGNESCIFPFFFIEQNWEDFLKLITLDLRIKIVLPRISQNELSPTIKLLKKIWSLQRDIEFVLNDWGVIFFCTQHLRRVNIHIGRQLCRSLIDCPWGNEILENENQTIQQMISSHPYDDLSRLNKIKEQGVYGIEFNSMPWIYEYHTFEEAKVETAINCDSYLLTCGKTCLAKRIVEKEECLKLCDMQFDITPAGKWMGYCKNRKAFDEYEKNLLNGMSIHGKSVLLPQRTEIKNIVLSGISVIISSDESRICLIRSMLQ